jgi:predicted DNA-binding transcriptional regulator YafY
MVDEAVGIERARAVQETVALDLDPLEANAETPEGDAAVGRHVLALSAAAHQGQRVRMRYRSPRESGAAETERALDPYGLVYHDARWYVVGDCHLRGEVRVFRLDRVLAVVPLAEHFTRPAGFDCLEFAVRRFAAMPDRWLVEVVLETTLDQLSRAVPSSFATLEEIPGGVLLRAYDADLDHTARFLVGLGCPFTVRQPSELRDALGSLSTWIARMVAEQA